MKKYQIICEPWEGRKRVYWEDDLSLNIYELVKYCKKLGFKSLKINFGPDRGNCERLITKNLQKWDPWEGTGKENK